MYRYIKYSAISVVLIITSSYCLAEDNTTLKQTNDKDSISFRSFNTFVYDQNNDNYISAEIKINNVFDNYSASNRLTNKLSIPSEPSFDRLSSQTNLIFGLGFFVIAIIAMLPEEISKWDRDRYSELGSNWLENVKAGPVWDPDVWWINYIGHPYSGAIYYQVARNSGYSVGSSFLYTALMSTFYWEYGIEAFAEIPSKQDLIVTPLGGLIIGEWFHTKEWQIRQRDGIVFGSKTLGSISLALMDPVGSVARGLNHLTGSKLIVVNQFSVSQKKEPPLSVPSAWDKSKRPQVKSNISYPTLTMQLAFR